MSEQLELTVRQQEVLNFIRNNSQFYGPTVREIAAAFGFKSLNAVQSHIKKLEKKGAIRRKPRSARGIEVIS